jgi:signal transduction histidine kinase
MLQKRVWFMKVSKRRTPRLKHARENRRISALSGLIDVSRVISFKLDDSALWDTVYDHLAATFDTSSFYVGIYDAERDVIDLPLVAENGMRSDHEPIPLCGLCRAVFLHGIEFYFRDLDHEWERLEALGVEIDEREPGTPASSWIGVPIRSRQNEVVGVISAQNYLPDAYADADLTILMAYAAMLALMYDNLRLVELERERRFIAGALMEIGQVVSGRADYDDVLDRILDQIHRLVANDSASILLEPVGHSSEKLIVCATHDPELFVKGLEIQLAEQKPILQAYTSQQPVVIDDSSAHRSSLLNSARSWLIAPMVVQDRVVGIITIGKQTARAYSQHDASTIFALARQAGIAVENARLHAQAQANVAVYQQRAQQLASLHHIAGVITSSLDKQEVLSTAARLLKELFDVDHCGVILLDPAEAEASPRYGTLVAEYPQRVQPGMKLSLHGNTTMEMLATYGTALAIDDVNDGSLDESTYELLSQIGARSVMLAPLIARDRLIGSIGLDMFSRQRKFTTEERETLMTIAGQVAMAASNAALYTAALEANRLKSMFLATISHELRTPLNAIIGYSDLLLSGLYGDITAAQEDRLERVNRSGKHLLSLINDLLDLSKIEAGEAQYAPTAVRVSTVLSEVLDQVAPRAEAKNLRIEISVTPDEQPVAADPQYLRQILTNLLDNAIKFTREGGIFVTVQPTRSNNGAANQHWFSVSVKDTGIGIAPADQKIIFESFRQVDGSTAREFGGTGLGLAITKRLVELQGGHIGVESSLGAGSTFTVVLPVYPGQ